MKVDLFGGASADLFCIGILNAGPKPNVLVSLTFACLAIDESNEEVTFLRASKISRLIRRDRIGLDSTLYPK